MTLFREKFKKLRAFSKKLIIGTHDVPFKMISTNFGKYFSITLVNK